MRRPPRRSSVGRKLLIAVVVLALLVVAADFGFRLWTESWVAGRVRESLGLSENPDVNLHGFPFTTQFARGSFDRVGLKSSGVTAEGLVLETVELDLRDVTFSRRQLLSDQPGTIRVARGSGHVRVTERALSAFLQENGFPVEVRFLRRRMRVSSTVSVGTETADASATGRLRVEGGALTFDPGNVEVEGIISVPASVLAFEVPFPELFRGVRPQTVRVRDGEAELELDVEQATIRVMPRRSPAPTPGG